MDIIIADIFFEFLGWMYLLLKYRDFKKISEIKESEYDGSYANAGHEIGMKAFLLVFGVLMLGLISVTLISIITHGFQK